MSTALTLIVACSSKNGIGKDGKLPWRLQKEMSYFVRVTTTHPPGTKNALIMGRTTFESIPPRFRPLKERISIVVTSRPLEPMKDTYAVDSLENAVKLLSSLKNPSIHHAFVIGGAQLYKSALAFPATDRVLLTRIHEPDFECDTFFPPIEEQGWTRASWNDLIKWVDLEGEVEKEKQVDAVWEYQMWTR